MAVHTSILVVALGLGILAARPDRGLMAVLSSGLLGGYLARRMIPLGMFLVFALGVLRLWGESRQYFVTEAGTVLFIVVLQVAFVAGMWIFARVLNRLHAQLERRNRMYATLSACNQLITRTPDEAELIGHIARILVGRADLCVVQSG